MPRYEVKVFQRRYRYALVELHGGPRKLELECDTRAEADEAVAFLRQIADAMNGNDTEPHVEGPDGCP